MAALNCADVIELVDARRYCEVSPFGTKITTNCLYPSASPVFVHIATWGDEFRVSDGGGAAQDSLRHGRDEWAVNAGLKAAKDRYSLSVEQGELFAFAKSAEWVPNVVAAVANGAAFAASSAIEHALHSQQKSLKERIGGRLREAVAKRFE